MQLAKSIADQEHRPVAVFFTKELPTLPAFSINPLDEANLLRRLGRKFGMESQGLKLYAFAPDAWPESVFRRNGYDGPGSGYAEVDKWPEKANSDGTVTIASDKRPFALHAVLEGPWPKPVRVAPLFQNLRVIVAAKNQPPDEVLRTVAAAVGARLEIGKNSWTLAFDGQEYRKRLIALLKNRIRDASRSATGALIVADANLCIAALDELTDKQLETAMVSPEAEMLIPVAPGSALVEPVMRRLDAYSQVRINGNTLGSQFTNMLDIKRPIQVVLSLLGGATAIQGKMKGSSSGITF